MLSHIVLIKILFLIVAGLGSFAGTLDLEKSFRATNHRVKLNVNDYFDRLQPSIGPFLKSSGFDPIELPRVEEKLAGQLLYQLYTGKFILRNGTLSDFSDIQRNGNSYILYDNKTIEARGGIKIRTVNFKYDYHTDLVALHYYGRVVGRASDIVVSGSINVDLDSYYLQLDRLDFETKGKLLVTLEGNAQLDWIWNAVTRIVTDTFKKQLSQVVTIKAREYISRLLVQMKNNDKENQIQDVTNLVIYSVG